MTETQFEAKWSQCVQHYSIHHDGFMTSMYEKRETWAETFLRGDFFAYMGTTQRCEGMNAFIKTKVATNMKLNDFIRRLDMALSWMQHKERKDDHESNHTMLDLGKTYMDLVEKQVATLYTRNLYWKIREQIQKGGKLSVSRKERGENENENVYLLTKYGDKSYRKLVRQRIPDKHLICECMLFTSCGIPCSHMFAIMKFLQITEIPKSLIAIRWLKTDFLHVYSNALLNSEMFHLPTKECHFTELIQDCNELAVVASVSEMRYSKAKEEIKKLLATLKLLEIDGNKNQTLVTPSLKVKNPLITRIKGTTRVGPNGPP
ncbi:protein FAR1-RELATED SEQUENCE 5-like [Humulus lupulus]|uniref:protein FAR1-RELATED SEQUENCE 5-like n=1 Tax=Humulus lupulus TaxID=3486 RepID=UPI002B40FBED|nr:protein FAR1-RELATED SEQUENCE 5-like [Humulus lupulus]